MSGESPRYEPWLAISAADYEGHMSAPGVGQLAALGEALAAALALTRPARLLVVGCATGNGFERVDPRVTRRVVGLDVNPHYLEVARERFGDTRPGPELICADVERHEFDRGSFDLIFAGLILEYVEPGPLLERMAGWLSDRGTCCVVIQVPDELHAPVSETGFGSLRALAPAMRLLTPSELARHAGRAGLEIADQRRVPLPGGKRLHVAHLRRAAPPRTGGGEQAEEGIPTDEANGTPAAARHDPDPPP